MGQAAAALKSIYEPIQSEVDRFEETLQKELAHENPFVTQLLKHSTKFQGKRVRPALLLHAAHILGGEVTDVHIALSAVVEMLHTATLVHDDVLDEASIRRHVATINSRWNNETSVLLGDYLFTHAFHLASSLESTLACRLIGRATNLVCEGELAQIHERGNLDLTEEQYFEIIEGKTAELCAICCFLGAHFAGAPKEVTEQLDAYGRGLGIAFQIADDLLDVLGNEGETGKSLGSDYRKQKLTLPIIHLLNQADEAERNRLKSLLATPSEAARLEVVQAAERAGSIAYARARATEFAEAARSSLSCLPESPARQILEDLTEFVTQRSA